MVLMVFIIFLKTIKTSKPPFLTPQPYPYPTLTLLSSVRGRVGIGLPPTRGFELILETSVRNPNPWILAIRSKCQVSRF